MLERLKYLFFAIILLFTIVITISTTWRKYKEQSDIKIRLKIMKELKLEADKNISSSFNSIYHNFRFAKIDRKEAVRFFRNHIYLNNPENDFYLAKSLLRTNDKHSTGEAVRILIKLAKNGHKDARKELCHKKQYSQCSVEKLKKYYDEQIRIKGVEF